MSFIKWTVRGYAGHSDYDGPEDFNFKREFITSSNINDDDIGAIINERFKEKRVLVYKIFKEKVDKI